MLVAETVLCGGPILTLDAADRVVEALAIWRGRIVAAGPKDAVLALAGPATRRVDLAGATVIPGLNDTHNHALWTGLAWTRVQLHQATTIAAVLAALAERARTTLRGQWIEASGRWHETRLAEGRLPTRQELDAACPDHPVYLPRGGHVAVANSLALALAGISDETPDPAGGSYGRDSAGRLTGLLLERPAYLPVKRLIPEPTHADRVAAVRRMAAAYNAAGLTSVRDPNLLPAEIRAYQEARAEDGLTLRACLLPFLNPVLHDDAEIGRQLDLWGPRSGFGDAWLRLGAVKLTFDGGVEAAYMHAPYANDPGFCGHPLFSAERLERCIRMAVARGWSTAVHAVGDAACGAVLSAYERVDREYPLAGRRCAIEHCFFPGPDTFARVQRLGLTITVQVPLLFALAGNMLIYWGPERAHRVLPVRSWLEHGIEPAGGSDSFISPYEPLLGLWATVTRQTDVAGVIGPEQGVPAPVALRMYTAWAARTTFEEGIKGTLEVGKLADLTVLGDNPLTCPPEAIRAIPVLKTMVGGRWVYEA